MKRRAFLSTLSTLAILAGCSTEPLPFSRACPRSDLPACDVRRPSCQAEAWRYWTCLAEQDGGAPPEVRVVPAEALPGGWPLRSLEPHRPAVRALGLWGPEEVPGPYDFFVDGDVLLLAERRADLPNLGAGFTRHRDLARLGRPAAPRDFSESLDRAARLGARSRIFAAFFRAAVEGGSFADHLGRLPARLTEARAFVLEGEVPLFRLLGQTTALVTREAERLLYRAQIRGFDRLLEARPRSSFDDRPAARPPALPPPVFPAGWAEPDVERLGPEVAEVLAGVSRFGFLGDALASSRRDGVEGFMWQVRVRIRSLPLRRLVEEVRGRGFDAAVVTRENGFVLHATDAAAPDLATAAAAWLDAAP